MRKRLISILVTSTLLSACAVGPKYEAPYQSPIVLQSVDAKAFAKEADTSNTKWWQFFDDTNLNILIDDALHHNHDIRVAEANLLAANALFAEKSWDRLPNVQGNGEYSRAIKEQGVADGGRQRLANESYRFGVGVTWEIDLWGRLKHLSESAKNRAQASVADLAMVRLSISGAVANQYYMAQGLYQKSQWLEQEINSWQNTLQVLSAQKKHGSGQPDDFAHANSQLLQAQAKLPVVNRQLQQTLNQLDVLTGKTPGQEQVWLRYLAKAPLSKNLPIGDVNALISQRPDVLKAERLLAAHTEEVGAATADLYPRLNLGGFLGFVALRGTDIGAGAKAFDITPNVSIPLLNLGNAKARLRAKKAETQGALAQYEKAILQAQEEVESAVIQLVQEQGRLKLLTASAYQSQKAVNIAQSRYKHGNGTYLSLLESQRAFYQVQQSLLEAETASYQNVVALYQSLAWGVY